MPATYRIGRAAFAFTNLQQFVATTVIEYVPGFRNGKFSPRIVFSVPRDWGGRILPHKQNKKTFVKTTTSKHVPFLF